MLTYLIAGEASGDALGAGLMHALGVLATDMQFAGVGGDMMAREGLHSLFPYNELSVMGFLEVVPHIPRFLWLLRKTVQDIAAKQPDVIITIDSPGFNFLLARMLKKNLQTMHIKRVHYVAPSVWAYKPERARKAAQLFDLLLAVLPFEPHYFENEGLKTVFVGHPALWEERKGDAVAFRRRYGLAENEQIVLVLPGSRPGEVKRHLSIFLAAAKTLKGFRIVIVASPQVREIVDALRLPGTIICGPKEKQDAFAAARLALSKSGTVTLELAVQGVPMAVAHKVSPLSAWLLRKMLLVKYASLVNIAADREIVPELLQENCTVKKIAEALHRLIERETMEKQLSDVTDALNILRGVNPFDPGVTAARAVLDQIGSR